MIKEFIGTGKTIDEATAAAKLGLNAPETADVKIEVVAMPEKKRFFGLFGGADAQVKASYDDGKKEKKPQPSKKKAAAKEPAKKKPVEKQSAPAKKEAPAQPKAQKPETDKPEDIITEKDINLDNACAYLKSMIDAMKVEDAKVTAEVVDGTVQMTVECEDYGIIIGRRGETLDALQYLTSLAIKNETSKYVRVTLNVGDYRDKREATLKALARKNAMFVLRTGRRYTFEPMNPYERRILHTAVQEIDGVISRSVGSGLDRKVIIEPEGGVKPQGRRGSSRGRRSDYSKNTEPTPSREKHVDRADMPKFGKIEVNRD